VSDFLLECGALTRRWWIHFRRNLGSSIFGVFQPLMWLLLFGFAFKGVAAGRAEAFGTGDYIAFQTAGLLAIAVLGNTLFGGVPFLFDQESGFLDKMLVAPIARSALFVSRFVFVTAVSTVQALLILLLVALLGVRVATGVGGLALIVVYTALLAAGLTAISIAMAFALRSHAAFFAITGFLMTPLLLVSSALVPLDVMPAWLRVAAYLNPLTHGIEPMRYLVLGRGGASVLLTSGAALLAFDAAFVAIAIRTMRARME